MWCSSPALSKNGVLYINKGSIYRTDLYSNLKVIFELILLSDGRFIKKIIALPEGSALYIKDKETKLIGLKEAIIFENNKTRIIKVGQNL